MGASALHLCGATVMLHVPAAIKQGIVVGPPVGTYAPPAPGFMVNMGLPIAPAGGIGLAAAPAPVLGSAPGSEGIDTGAAIGGLAIGGAGGWATYALLGLGMLPAVAAGAALAVASYFGIDYIEKQQAP
jgi:hypothetical protein